MNQLLLAGFIIAALSSGAMAKPKSAPAPAASHHLRVVLKRDNRAEKTKQYIASDLHRRGSNIPPAYSADGHWSR